MARRQIVLLIAVLALTTAGRLWLASRLPLVDDEAYYWAWAQRLAWGYPDHPPAIAALIRFTTSLLGNTPLGVRSAPVVLSLGTTLLLFDWGRVMFGPIAGMIAALGYQIIPAFSIGSMFAFPDAPFVFFWTLALWALWRARTWGRAVDWYLAGLAAGLAAMSKMSVLFLAISMVGFLTAAPSERHWWRRPVTYRAAAIALAVFLPVVSWNAAHGWITFERAREPIPWVATGIPALNAAAFLAAQLAYYGLLTAPLLVVALVAATVAPRRHEPRYAFLIWGAWPIIVLTWAASFDGLPKPHWHAAGFLVALVAAGALWGSGSLRRWLRSTVIVAVTVNLAVMAILVSLPFRLSSPTAGQIWGWDQVAAALRPLVEQTPASPGRFVLTSSYQKAGQIEFQVNRVVTVTTPYGGDAYGFWLSKQRLIDWNAIYLNDLASGPGVPLRRMFRKIEPLPPIEIMLAGRVARRFSVYRGLGFRGFPHPLVRAD